MTKTPNKQDVALALLSETTIFVHLDPRRPKVVVPESFRQQPELVLQFGLNMAVAIRDLEVSAEGISGTLSFSRRPFWCQIPWEAVYAIVSESDKRGMVWPDDAPRESKLAGASPRAPVAKRSHLRAVGPDAPPDEEEAEGVERNWEGRCKHCAIAWLEGSSSCPVCGGPYAEAFVPTPPSAEEVKETPSTPPKPQLSLAPAPDKEPQPSSAPEPDDPPPDSPPTKGASKRPPWLRVVK